MLFFASWLVAATTGLWALEFPKDLPKASRDEIFFVQKGLLSTHNPESVKQQFCPAEISPATQLWLWNRVREGLAVSALRGHFRAVEHWDNITKTCKLDHLQFPHVSTCMQRALKYQITSEKMSLGTANNPNRATLPEFLTKDKVLLDRLLSLKDVEAARKWLQKKAPQCRSYRATGSIPAGTFADSYGRLMIHCPEKEGWKYISVSYRTDAEAESRHGPLGNISVVEEQPRANGQKEVWYADFERSKDKPVTFKRMAIKQNCASCHPSGATAIHKSQVDPRHLNDWKQAWAHRDRDFVYTPDDEGKDIDFDALGPALGKDLYESESLKLRSDDFFKRCLSQFSPQEVGAVASPEWNAFTAKVRKNMDCASCHNGDKGNYLAGRFAPALRGPMLRSVSVSGAIRHGLMPPGASLTMVERDALLFCLNYEAYGSLNPDDVSLTNGGEVLKWLMEVDCQTGSRRNADDGTAETVK